MTPDEVYVVLRELKEKPDTLEPVCYFLTQNNAQMFISRQKQIHTSFDYYVDSVTHGELLRSEL